MLIPVRRTTLFPVHEELDAKLILFEGWEMPLQYTSIMEEHVNTRENASLFDITHMGEFLVEGSQAHDLLQYVCTNDLSLIGPGGAQYSPMCNDDGTVVDDIFCYCYSRSKYRLFVNASNRQKDLLWLETHAVRFDNVTVKNVSDERTRMTLQGPKSQDILESLVPDNLDEMKRFTFIETNISGISAFIARTGYTGEDGFEISCKNSDGIAIWEYIMAAGKEFGILPAGLGARDTLRLEASYSLYGHEISEEITPIEGGVEFVVKPTKKEDYIGRKVLETQLNSFISRKIIAIEAMDRGVFRHDQDVYDKTGEVWIGKITSGTFSPTFKKGIALALVNSKYKVIGDEVLVRVRDRFIRGKIVHRPFYDYHPRSK
ncbi:glycine cleavage system aminomethyltransferase GcvT [Candidatus Bathyarchaeota archaeon]|nr:glycine cleavage system aminomethyltransferase GcvT [Candidatus Bathyarchaeota archaeon]